AGQPAEADGPTGGKVDRLTLPGPQVVGTRGAEGVEEGGDLGRLVAGDLPLRGQDEETGGERRPRGRLPEHGGGERTLVGGVGPRVEQEPEQCLAGGAELGVLRQVVIEGPGARLHLVLPVPAVPLLREGEVELETHCVQRSVAAMASKTSPNPSPSSTFGVEKARRARHRPVSWRTYQ